MTEPLTLEQRLIQKAQNELGTYQRVGKQTSSDLIVLAIQQETELTRLHADNKALTAEVADITGTLKYCEECWSDERGTMIDKIQFERARATAAEAKLAKVEETLADPVAVHANILAGKIAIPDDLVWLHDTNGPVAAISAELAEARKERDGLALIVNARKKHVDAVAAYNARREVLKTVPLGCRNLDIEFRAFSDAQSDFIATAQNVADSFLASKEASHAD